jgi:hypothetical protein
VDYDTSRWLIDRILDLISRLPYLVPTGGRAGTATKSGRRINQAVKCGLRAGVALWSRTDLEVSYSPCPMGPTQ